MAQEAYDDSLETAEYIGYVDNTNDILHELRGLLEEIIPIIDNPNKTWKVINELLDPILLLLKGKEYNPNTGEGGEIGVLPNLEYVVRVMNEIINNIKESRGPTKVPMEIDHEILIMINAKRLELQSKTYILEKVVSQRNRKEIKKALQLVKGVVAKLINIWNEGGEGNNGGKKSIYARARNWKPENRNAQGGTRKRTLNKNKTRKNKATKKDLQMLAKNGWFHQVVQRMT